MMRPPLEGIAVIETSTYVSGPFAGMILADLGASVIKVEPPSGDPFRRYGGRDLSPQWMACNRGKRSVALDLKTRPGVASLLDLVETADVFCSNWRPEVAVRLGIGDEVLAGRNARLIRLWMTGWGRNGPAADETAFDAVVQARSGMIDAAARSDIAEPVPGWPVDKATSFLAVQSILAALYARERTGSGERIDLAMLDVACYVNFPDLFTSRVILDQQPEDAHSTSATAMRTFQTSDGPIIISAVTGAQIKGACLAVGHPEWTTALFAAGSPTDVMTEMHRLFSPVLQNATRADWVRRFVQHDVPAGVCLTIDEHFVDPQVVHNDIYRIERWADIGDVRTVRFPATSSQWGRLSAGPAPTTAADPADTRGRPQEVGGEPT